jgi:predicted nucleic acid-binding protein
MSADRSKPRDGIQSVRTHNRIVLPKEVRARLSDLVAGDQVVIARSGKPVARVEPPTKFPRTFLDTNILVYAEDESEPVKRKKAVALILEHKRQRTGVVSLQILQEFFNAVTRKLKLDAGVARYKVEFHSRFVVGEPTVPDILAAIDIHRLHSFSFWDALVLRMAKQTGCRVLLSEDMQHGQEFDGVKIVNPFL